MFVFGGKKLRIFIGVTIGFFILLFLTQGAWAGFGITPPYFINHNLTEVLSLKRESGLREATLLKI